MLAFGEVDVPLARLDHRPEQCSPAPLRELLAAPRTLLPSRLDLPHREHDLDKGRQHGRPLEHGGRRRLRATDRAHGGVAPTLCEPELGETGLGPRRPARFSYAVLGAAEGRLATAGALRGGKYAQAGGRGSASRRNAPLHASPARALPATNQVELQDLRPEQRPVTRSAHQSERARVQSRARRTSNTSWQAMITPQHPIPANDRCLYSAPATIALLRSAKTPHDPATPH